MATRRERVVLELEDQFTTGMARAAASAALLNRELDSLSKDSIRTRRSISDIDRPIQDVGRSAGRSGNEIDKMSGRMRILADVTAVLGPGLVGIGAVGVPAITGLAAQLGFAATGAATMVIAFQGVGDTLKALNKAALEPTTQNLEAAQVQLEKLSPAAQEFVSHVGALLPELRKLRDVAAEGLFPGLTRALDEMESALPHVQGLIGAVADELGRIAGDTGASLASDRWTSFLDFIAREAPAALGQMADAAGNTAHAVAELWMATDPINDDFSTWLVNATADLDRWATGLSRTQGFADFMAYLDKTGPKVADAFGAIANAALQIVQAAAPLSGPVLDGVKALADVVSAIADSDLGTPLFVAVGALSLFNRTMSLTRAAGNTTFGGFIAGQTRASLGLKSVIADLRVLTRESKLVSLPRQGFIGPLTQAQVALTRLRDPRTGLSATLKSVGKSAALLGGVGIAATGAADGIGLTNTASLALAGTIAGPWGAAVGGAVGLLLDAKGAGQGFADAMNRANVAVRGFDATAIEKSIADLKKQRKDLTDVTGFGDFFGDLSTQALHTKPLPGAAGPVEKIDQKLKELQGQLKVTRAEAEKGFSTDGFEATAAGIDDATSSTQDFLNKLQELSDVLAGRASFRDFEQSIDDFAARAIKRAKLLGEVAQAQQELANAKTPEEKKAARQRIKDLNDQADALKNSLNVGTQAGRDTQAALDNIAATALRVAQGLDPIARAEFLAGARREFIKAAVAAGHTADEAKRLADRVLGLSAIKGEPKIVIDADGAWRVIDKTAAKLERLTRKTYKLNIQAQASSTIPQVLDAQAHASGGTVGGPRYPYGDKVLTMLAPGEEVVTNRNGEADRWRPLLKRINAGLANGGTVPFATGGPGVAVGIDYERLAKAMAAVRPMYGDAHFYGDAAKREQDRLSALDGRKRP